MSCINHPSTTHFLVRFRRDRILQLRSCLTLLACLSVIGSLLHTPNSAVPPLGPRRRECKEWCCWMAMAMGPPVTSPRPSTNMRSPLANSPRSDKVFARGRQPRKLDLA
jgi:hypothetical protein